MEIETKNPLSNARIIGSQVDQDVYHATNGGGRGDPDHIMSRGEIVEFARCPHRWLMGYGEEDDGTPATDWGEIADCLALSPGQFKDRFIVLPETYPDRKTGEPKPWNWNATFCQEWRDFHKGKITVKPDTFQQAQNAVKFLFGDHQIAEFINSSIKQVFVMAEYRDEETEIVVPIKCLIDLVPNLLSSFAKDLGDFKTCRNAAPFAWNRAVFEHGYNLQAALYRDAYVAATGEDRSSFRHILQESFPPWEVGKRIVSAEFMELGRATYLNALRRYCQCLETGVWPGYDDNGRLALDGWLLSEPEPWMIAQA